MAGHSQFKNIMHRKGAQDAKRARLFARLTREVQVAARMGAPDPGQNPRLRSAIAAARGANMPRDNIERAIRKAAGDGDDTHFEDVRYEGYGPGGVAIMVEALTDNRNRTAAGVRAAFSKFGGTLGETGSVGFMFDRVGRILYPAGAADPDAMFEAALQAGAEDATSTADDHRVTCAPDTFHEVREHLETRFGPPREAALTWRPRTGVPVDEAAAAALLRLLDALDDCDDVQRVAANAEIPDRIADSLAG